MKLAIGGWVLAAPFDGVLAGTIVQPELLSMTEETPGLLHDGRLHGGPS